MDCQRTDNPCALHDPARNASQDLPSIYRMEQRVRDGYARGIAGGASDARKTNIAASPVGRRVNQRG